MRLANYADKVPLPTTCTWADPSATWELGENDEIGDCAIVAPANLIIATSSTAKAPKRLALADILAAYKAVGRWDGTPNDASDNGCVISDVLAYWHATGIGEDTIDAFAEIDISDIYNIKRALVLCGPVDIGLSLPIAAQAWGTDSWPAITSTDVTGDNTPGSWGGHSVALVKYDAEHVWIVTWGKLVAVPWSTLLVYLEEAWAVVDCDALTAANVSPDGLDLATMIADCKAMQEASA
jgi:hypothetical protein